MVDNILRIISNAVNVYNAKEYWHTQDYPWSEVRFKYIYKLKLGPFQFLKARNRTIV